MIFSGRDFDQSLTYMELPYYRYEFERKKRRLEEKRRSDGWLNDEVRYGAICHDSRGNLVDGLGNLIKEAEIEFQTVYLLWQSFS
ncbi:MAG: hypothetical protein WBL67_16285 [Nitrososphaeraceae archaeon]